MAIIKNNKSASLSRYSLGVSLLNHKGRTVTTSVGSSFDSFLINLDSIPSRAGIVPSFCSNRPDNISNIHYSTPGYWWYIMQYNNYFDPFEELNTGDHIKIPDLS